MTNRYTTKLGDHREHAIRCDLCGRDTWALDRLCDECFGTVEVAKRYRPVIESRLSDSSTAPGSAGSGG